MSRPRPAWLSPLVEAADRIEADDLTRFVPPPGSDAREGAVLMLFGEGEQGPDVLLTERAHDMRSHPGQVSFPGGSVDPGDASHVAAALREAEEETGLDPAGVDVFGTLPQLWLPPSNFAVTPVVGWWAQESAVAVVDPGEVASVHRTPIAELLDPAHRFTVRHPSGFRGPAFWIGPDKDLLLWGFTAGILSRVFDFVGWTRAWDTTLERDLPERMLGVGENQRRTAPNTRFEDDV